MDSEKQPGGNKKVILPYMEIEMMPDNVARFTLLKDTHIDMQKAMEMVNICKELYAGRIYKSLKIVHHRMRLENKVMEFLASDARKSMINLEAVVVNSSALKILGNFYLTIKRPVIKTRVFDSEEEAMHWLRHNGNG